MKIIYKTGDLFNDNPRIIAHGCNAQGKMGSGFAKQIKEKHPESYKYYLDVHNRNELLLGENYVYIGKTMVIHCITQQYYGYDGKLYLSYDALQSCVDELSEKLKPAVEVAMPKIGAGLAGGDWNKIEKILESGTFQPVVYTL